MATEYLLDTNVAALVAARNAQVTPKVTAAAAIYLPSVVVSELYYGAYRIEQTKRGRTLIAEYDVLVQATTVLSCDSVTAILCARLRADLDAAGNRIPLHDAWIAALAIQYSLTVATRDAHFDVVPGLTVDRW